MTGTASGIWPEGQEADSEFALPAKRLVPAATVCLKGLEVENMFEETWVGTGVV